MWLHIRDKNFRDRASQYGFDPSVNYYHMRYRLREHPDEYYYFGAHLRSDQVLKVEGMTIIHESEVK